MPANLATCRRKRDFKRTPEPSGSAHRHPRGNSFVVQKHAARRLHYDFRLELDGVLKSWAVPKGPSREPGEKRLAVRTEDHPLEYGRFHGVIPEGDYGAGNVELWDHGVWIPDGDPREGLARGRLKFRLQGKKLHGGWALVRMGGRNGSRNGKENWLLIKDKPAGEVVREEPKAPAPARSAPRSSRRRRKVRTRGSEDGAPIAGVTLTHPDRILYPAQGITKCDLARFYEEIADWILPHIVERPLSLVRCPEGQGKACFYQKHAGAGAPGALKGVKVKEKGAVRTYLYVEDLSGLISLVQMGVLELHPWGSRVGDLEHPDRLTFDLDPAPGLPWKRVVDTARQLRSLLAKLRLTSFVKTTGGKGLHVVVPLAPKQPWESVKGFALAIAESMARQAPSEYTANLSKANRKGKIFIDYLRNSHGATAVAAYSTRALAGAPVATPIAWDELGADLRSDHYTVENLPRRLASLKKDPWEGFLKSRQTIPSAARSTSEKKSVADE